MQGGGGPATEPWLDLAAPWLDPATDEDEDLGRRRFYVAARIALDTIPSMLRELFLSYWQAEYGTAWTPLCGHILLNGGRLPPYDTPLPGTFKVNPGLKKYKGSRVQCVYVSADLTGTVAEGDSIRLDDEMFTLVFAPEAPTPIEERPGETIDGKLFVDRLYPATSRTSVSAFCSVKNGVNDAIVRPFIRSDGENFAARQVTLLRAGDVDDWDTTLVSALLAGCTESPYEPNEKIARKVFNATKTAGGDVAAAEEKLDRSLAMIDLRNGRNAVAHANSPTMSTAELRSLVGTVQESVSRLFSGDDAARWSREVEDLKRTAAGVDVATIERKMEEIEARRTDIKLRELSEQVAEFSGKTTGLHAETRRDIQAVTAEIKNMETSSRAAKEEQRLRNERDAEAEYDAIELQHLVDRQKLDLQCEADRKKLEAKHQAQGIALKPSPSWPNLGGRTGSFASLSALPDPDYGFSSRSRPLLGGRTGSSASLSPPCDPDSGISSANSSDSGDILLTIDTTGEDTGNDPWHEKVVKKKDFINDKLAELFELSLHKNSDAAPEIIVEESRDPHDNPVFEIKLNCTMEFPNDTRTQIEAFRLIKRIKRFLLHGIADNDHKYIIMWNGREGSVILMLSAPQVVLDAALKRLGQFHDELGCAIEHIEPVFRVSVSDVAHAAVVSLLRAAGLRTAHISMLNSGGFACNIFASEAFAARHVWPRGPALEQRGIDILVVADVAVGSTRSTTEHIRPIAALERELQAAFAGTDAAVGFYHASLSPPPATLVRTAACLVWIGAGEPLVAEADSSPRFTSESVTGTAGSGACSLVVTVMKYGARRSASHAISGERSGSVAVDTDYRTMDCAAIARFLRKAFSGDTVDAALASEEALHSISVISGSVTTLRVVCEGDTPLQHTGAITFCRISRDPPALTPSFVGLPEAIDVPVNQWESVKELCLVFAKVESALAIVIVGSDAATIDSRQAVWVAALEEHAAVPSSILVYRRIGGDGDVVALCAELIVLRQQYKDRRVLLWVDFADDTSNDRRLFTALDGIDGLSWLVIVTGAALDGAEEALERPVSINRSVVVPVSDSGARVSQMSEDLLQLLPDPAEQMSALDLMTAVTARSAVEAAIRPLQAEGEREALVQQLYRGDDGRVVARLRIPDVSFFHNFRDSLLDGTLSQRLHEEVAAVVGGRKFDVRLDTAAFTVLYDQIRSSLDQLTPHQREKLCECNADRVHISGPAGSGKTFIALHRALQVLESSAAETVLFVAKNEAMCVFFVRWLIARVAKPGCSRQYWTDLVTSRVRVQFSPFVGCDRAPVLTDSDFTGFADDDIEKGLGRHGVAIFDEAQHLFDTSPANTGNRKAVEKLHREASASILISDRSQDVSNDPLALPAVDVHVKLTEVVRNSSRIVVGSLPYSRDSDQLDINANHTGQGPSLVPIWLDNDEEYAEHVCTALASVKSQGIGLHDNVAILVPDEMFSKELKSEMQLLLSGDFEAPRLLSALDCAKVQGTARREGDGPRIVFDTVNAFDGMERLAIIAVGLDTARTVGGCSMIYRAMTRAHTSFTFIQRPVLDGWLTWIGDVSFSGESNFDAQVQRENIRHNNMEVIRKWLVEGASAEEPTEDIPSKPVYMPQTAEPISGTGSTATLVRGDNATGVANASSIRTEELNVPHSGQVSFGSAMRNKNPPVGAEDTPLSPATPRVPQLKGNRLINSQEKAVGVEVIRPLTSRSGSKQLHESISDLLDMARWQRIQDALLKSRNEAVQEIGAEMKAIEGCYTESRFGLDMIQIRAQRIVEHFDSLGSGPRTGVVEHLHRLSDSGTSVPGQTRKSTIVKAVYDVACELEANLRTFEGDVDGVVQSIWKSSKRPSAARPKSTFFPLVRYQQIPLMDYLAGHLVVKGVRAFEESMSPWVKSALNLHFGRPHDTDGTDTSVAATKLRPLWLEQALATLDDKGVDAVINADAQIWDLNLIVKIIKANFMNAFVPDLKLTKFETEGLFDDLQKVLDAWNQWHKLKMPLEADSIAFLATMVRVLRRCALADSRPKHTGNTAAHSTQGLLAAEASLSNMHDIADNLTKKTKARDNRSTFERRQLSIIEDRSLRLYRAMHAFESKLGSEAGRFCISSKISCGIFFFDAVGWDMERIKRIDKLQPSLLHVSKARHFCLAGCPTETIDDLIKTMGFVLHKLTGICHNQDPLSGDGPPAGWEDWSVKQEITGGVSVDILMEHSDDMELPVDFSLPFSTPLPSLEDLMKGVTTSQSLTPHVTGSSASRYIPPGARRAAAASASRYITPGAQQATSRRADAMSPGMLSPSSGPLGKHKHDDTRYTALHRIVDEGDAEQIISKLPDLVQHVNSVNKGGWTPLRNAVSVLKDDAVGIAALKALLDNNADPFRDGGCKGGLLPIHDAVREGKIGFVRLLIEREPRLIAAATSAPGLHPLHYAPQAKKHRAELVALLLEKGANPRAKTLDGNLPLHYAAAAADQKDFNPLNQIAVYDLCRCEDSDTKNKEGWTAFGKLITSLIRRCGVNKSLLKLSEVRLAELVFDIDERSAQALLGRMSETTPEKWQTRHFVFREICKRDKSKDLRPF